MMICCFDNVELLCSPSCLAVGTLVSALKKQAKFRQLVEYSLDTLVKVISHFLFVIICIPARLMCLFFHHSYENYLMCCAAENRPN